jgi:hypothetical protein
MQQTFPPPRPDILPYYLQGSSPSTKGTPRSLSINIAVSRPTFQCHATSEIVAFPAILCVCPLFTPELPPESWFRMMHAHNRGRYFSLRKKYLVKGFYSDHFQVASALLCRITPASGEQRGLQVIPLLHTSDDCCCCFGKPHGSEALGHIDDEPDLSHSRGRA